MVPTLILKQCDPVPRIPTAKAAAPLLGPWAPAAGPQLYGVSVCVSHRTVDSGAGTGAGTPACTSTHPVAQAASEALGAWHARVPDAAFPALWTGSSWSVPTMKPSRDPTLTRAHWVQTHLEASDTRGPGRALWAQSPLKVRREV